jgi:hypothetical protein
LNKGSSFSAGELGSESLDVPKTLGKVSADLRVAIDIFIQGCYVFERVMLEERELRRSVDCFQNTDCVLQKLSDSEPGFI